MFSCSSFSQLAVLIVAVAVEIIFVGKKTNTRKYKYTGAISIFCDISANETWAAASPQLGFLSHQSRKNGGPATLELPSRSQLAPKMARPPLDESLRCKEGREQHMLVSGRPRRCCGRTPFSRFSVAVAVARFQGRLQDFGAPVRNAKQDPKFIKFCITNELFESEGGYQAGHRRIVLPTPVFD